MKPKDVMDKKSADAIQPFKFANIEIDFDGSSFLVFTYIDIRIHLSTMVFEKIIEWYNTDQVICEIYTACDLIQHKSSGNVYRVKSTPKDGFILESGARAYVLIKLRRSDYPMNCWVDTEEILCIDQNTVHSEEYFKL